MKIRCKAKIPDYVQLRDERFTLLAYFRADRPDEALRKLGLEQNTVAIKEIIEHLPYGKMQKLELKNGRADH